MGSKPVTVSNPSAAGTLLAKRKAKQGILVLQGEAEVKNAFCGLKKAIFSKRSVIGLIVNSSALPRNLESCIRILK